MPVNRRLIMLVITALISAFLVNHVVNLAQTSIESGQWGGGSEGILMQSTTTYRAAEAVAQPGEAPTEARKEEALEPEVLPLLTNITYSFVAAIAAFLLIRRIKLKIPKDHMGEWLAENWSLTRH